MKNRVYYIGSYGSGNNLHKRDYSLSATKKMDYISNKICDLGYKLTILSPTWSKESKLRIDKSRVEALDDRRELVLCPTYGAKNKLLKAGRYLLSQIWLAFWLIKNTDREDNVVVYHAYRSEHAILFARAVKHFKITLEVEEIYQEVWKIPKFYHKVEYKMINSADAYIFVSHALKEKINRDKPYAVAYGNYRINNEKSDAADENKIKMVFTGQIEKTRGGAFEAVKCLEYLPEKYELYISGYCIDDCEQELKKMIDEINQKTGRNACTYLGRLDENEYDSFMRSADIALNPQKDGKYSEFLFPSKLLAYLSYSLRVVSTKGKSIVSSPFREYIYFAEDYTPQALAKAVLSVDVTKPYSAAGVLKEQNRVFENELRHCIELQKG